MRDPVDLTQLATKEPLLLLLISKRSPVWVRLTTHPALPGVAGPDLPGPTIPAPLLVLILLVSFPLTSARVHLLLILLNIRFVPIEAELVSSKTVPLMKFYNVPTPTTFFEIKTVGTKLVNVRRRDHVVMAKWFPIKFLWWCMFRLRCLLISSVCLPPTNRLPTRFTPNRNDT